MNVSSCNNRDSQFIAQLDDGLVKLLQFADALNSSVMHHELVVADWLNFQIIIKTCDPAQLIPAFSRYNCAEQLASLARASDKQSFSVFDQFAFRDKRTLFKIV